MAFSAIVLDNKNFFQTGKITVRIAKYYNSPIVWDLTDDSSIYDRFKKTRDKKGKSKGDGTKFKVEDFDNCLVSSPLGGGRNYGLFTLPQINSVGRVSFLDNSFSQPIWEGSFWRPISSNKTKVDYINIPNDQPTQEGKNTDGSAAGNNLEGDEGTIILRTKTTTEDEYDWQQNSTENLVVLDKNKLKIIHFLEWDNNTPKKWQEITIENGEVSVKVVNDTDNKTANLLIKEDEILSELDDSGEKTSLKLSTSDPSFEFVGPNSIKFFGDADYLAKYNDLVDLMDRISTHKHVCPVNGMTAEVLDGGAPMSSSIKSVVQSMKAERLKVE